MSGEDDDERGIKNKGIEEATVIKGIKESRHDEFGGSAEEMALVKNNKLFIKWQDKKLIKVYTRPQSKGATYFTINHSHELNLISGEPLAPPEAERVRLKIEKTFNIKLSTSKNSYKGVDVKAFKGKYRGYATPGTLAGIVGIAGAGIALIGGLEEAIEWLEFPEQIDTIKKSKIDPSIVQRALTKNQFESLYSRTVSRLTIVKEVQNNQNVPTNVMIDSETGILYCVVLESTEKYQLGQIVGVKQLSFHDKINNSRVYRDYDNGLTYASLPGEGWITFHFRFDNTPD